MEEKQETPKKEEIPKKKVTKEKNPGRVAAGKRLAERNKLKKLEAKNKEHKEKIIIQEESKEENEERQNNTIEKPVEVNIYKTSNVALFLLAGVVGGGIYIYQKWKTNKNEVKTKEIKSEPVKPGSSTKFDPFYME